MTLYVRLSDGAFGLSPHEVQDALPEISFVAGADLNEWGYAPYAPAPPPALEPGQVAVEVAPVDGVQQWLVQAGPPPPRPQLPKSTIIERVIDADKIDAVHALLMAHPIFHAQWTSPDWPNVFCDDPGLIIALNAVGCTEAEILAITAP